MIKTKKHNAYKKKYNKKVVYIEQTFIGNVSVTRYMKAESWDLFRSSVLRSSVCLPGVKFYTNYHLKPVFCLIQKTELIDRVINDRAIDLHNLVPYACITD